MMAIKGRLMQAFKDKQFDLVLAEYEAMLTNGFMPDLLSVNCIVEAMGQQEGFDAAQKILQELELKNPKMKVNARTYAALIKPLTSSRDQPVQTRTEHMNAAFALYDEMLSREIAPDLVLYNALIHACTEAGDFDRAEGIFKEMRDQGVKPKSMSYIVYIYGCFRSREPELAYKMLLNMEAEWRVPSADEYSRMLTLFLKLDHMEGQLRCIKGLTADGLARLDVNTTNKLFRSAQEKRDPELVVRLAESLALSGIKLDRFNTVGVVFAHLSLGQVIKAFGVVIDLYKDGHTIPERAAEGIAMDLAKQASLVDESYYLIESRKADGEEVPIAAVNMVIEACALMGDLDRAFATWAELEQLELKPDIGTYNALLHTCVKSRELASGRRLLARMEQEGFTPNANTYWLQSVIHIMSKQQQQAMQALEQCKADALVPPAKMYVGLINLMLRVNNPAKAQELLDDMDAVHTVTASLKKKVADALERT